MLVTVSIVLSHHPLIITSRVQALFRLHYAHVSDRVSSFIHFVFLVQLLPFRKTGEWEIINHRSDIQPYLIRRLRSDGFVSSFKTLDLAADQSLAANLTYKLKFIK